MFDDKYFTLDEIKIKGKKGKVGTHLRLAKTEKGPKVIQLWSSLSKQWNVSQRYNVEEEWKRWKAVEQSIAKTTSK